MSHYHAALRGWLCCHQHRTEETARECSDRDLHCDSPGMVWTPRCDCSQVACRVASWEEDRLKKHLERVVLR